MSDFKGDYMGFTYNGIHSSGLGIVRVSDGSRFNENLLPTAQDKTATVPGRDGAYYFGSNYTQRQFTVPFAFDSLTESQFSFLRHHFGDKKIHSLVFDELPYKTYQAKVTGNATIKYVPFEVEGARVYKGEGTIQFTCYNPFAKCEKKYLSEYSEYDNIDEWAEASGLVENGTAYETMNPSGFKLYNPGDIETDWVLTIKADEGFFSGCTLTIPEVEGALKFADTKVKEHPYGAAYPPDTRLTFDSKTGLIEGLYLENGKYVKSGNLYNEYITAGDFFKIPVTARYNLESMNFEAEEVYFNISMSNMSHIESLKYNYYYY